MRYEGASARKGGEKEEEPPRRSPASSLRSLLRSPRASVELTSLRVHCGRSTVVSKREDRVATLFLVGRTSRRKHFCSLRSTPVRHHSESLRPDRGRRPPASQLGSLTSAANGPPFPSSLLLFVLRSLLTYRLASTANSTPALSQLSHQPLARSHRLRPPPAPPPLPPHHPVFNSQPCRTMRTS